MANLLVLLFAMLGACFGSFLALIIYRLPKGQSIIRPRSHCESCKRPLMIWHNLPIVSWLLLGGKCYYCHTRIGVRSLFIEFIMAICMVGLYLKFGLSIALFDRFFFVFFLVGLAYIDLDTFLLPLSLLVSLTVLGLLMNLIYFVDPKLYMPPSLQPAILNLMVFYPKASFSLSDRLLGAIVGFSFLSIINLVATAILRLVGRLTKTQWSMGFGDSLLLMAIALYVGLSHLVLVVFLASVMGSIVGIISRVVDNQAQHREDIAEGAVPYGPFLAIAAIYVYVC